MNCEKIERVTSHDLYPSPFHKLSPFLRPIFIRKVAISKLLTDSVHGSVTTAIFGTKCLRPPPPLERDILYERPHIADCVAQAKFVVRRKFRARGYSLYGPGLRNSDYNSTIKISNLA